MTKKMRKINKIEIILCVVFAGIVYGAMTTDSVVLDVIVVCIVWITLISNLKSSASHFEEYGFPATFDKIFNVIYSLSLAFVFFYYGWVITAWAWSLFTLIMLVTYLGLPSNNNSHQE